MGQRTEEDGRGGNRYVYAGLGIGHHETRHEAIGYAAVAGRRGTGVTPFSSPETPGKTRENIMHHLSQVYALDRGATLDE